MSSEQAQVVVGFDLTQGGQAALHRAVALAAREPFHVLHFACIADPHAGIRAVPTKHVDLVYADQLRDMIAAAVEDELRATHTPAQIHFHIHVRIARNAGKEILDIAEEVGADLVVVGNAGHGKIERFVLGSVSDRVVRDAKCAVVIARPKEYAFVAHTEVTEVDHKLHQRMEHHYTYQDHRATMRPSDWPIY